MSVYTSQKNLEYMEIDEIKKIPITGYLANRGIKPNKTKGNAYFYRAFYRGGDNPCSVRVDIVKNLWFDYVTGQGGSIIDLVMVSEHCTEHDAMMKLSGEQHRTWEQPKITTGTKNEGITVQEIRDIYYYPVQEYIKGRGISVDVAKRFCKEIHFTFGTGKPCFGLAFPTDSGSYIIRNKKFKGCTGQDITTVIFSDRPVYGVFEGFFDFLSFVQLYGTPKINCVILNSVTNIKRAYSLFSGATRVFLMLDNDDKGREVTNAVKAKFGAKIIDKSYHYAPCKDFNEYLIQERGKDEI